MLNERSFSGPRAFARWMMARDSRLLIAPPDPRYGVRCVKGLFTEAVLFRESCWQLQLVYVFPHVVVQEHRHNRVASCELALCGSGDAQAKVGGRDVRPQRGPLRSNLLLVDIGQWHGGAAGENGVLWLSFQHWREGLVGWIGDDWEERL